MKSIWVAALLFAWLGCDSQVEQRNNRPLVPHGRAAASTVASLAPQAAVWTLTAGQLDTCGIPEFVSEVFQQLTKDVESGFTRVATGIFDELSPHQRAGLQRNAQRASLDVAYLGETYTGLYESDDASSNDTYQVFGGFWVLHEEAAGVRVISVSLATGYPVQRNAGESEIEMFLQEKPLVPGNDDAWIESIKYQNIDALDFIAKNIAEIQAWVRDNIHQAGLGVRIAELIAAPDYRWGKSRVIVGAT